jgi:leader peptidase (prepilin peptidase) / N-methyltransferase
MVVSVSLLGAVIGSFLNVVIHRLPRRESLAFPASRCTSCGERIRVRDNVPVLSWIALRGRCRGCAQRISSRYPVVELITALLFAAVGLVRGFDADLFVELPLVAVLVAVAAIDLEHHLIPNRILLPAAAFAIVVTALVEPGQLPERLIAAAGAFGFLLLAALAYPGGMGMGDVKLAGVMGLYLGASVVPALAVAFLAGSVVGVALMARQGFGARKRGLPFGPFLAVGGCVGLLAGPELIGLYTHIVLS